MNRLKHLLDNPGPPEGPDDFYEIECGYNTFIISGKVALDVERRLDQSPPPVWIAFRDLTGARHRILAAKILRISESTSAQRASEREFRRARRVEDKGDRPWEEDY
jgi:hypothetical protein